MTWEIKEGDCREIMRAMDPESVQCVVTSPPYWGLRDYNLDPMVWGGDHECEHKKKQMSDYCLYCPAWIGSLGLEPTIELYLEHVLEVFAEVWRVLRKDGTLWLNIGDSYATGAGKVGKHPGGGAQGEKWNIMNGANNELRNKMTPPNRMPQAGLKPKDLCLIPFRLALALHAAGWWVRSDIIWHKPNPMPESVTDRPTRAHEYIFLLTKSSRYYYDGDAIKEPASTNTHARRSNKIKVPDGWDTAPGAHGTIHGDGRKLAEPGSGIKSNESFAKATEGHVLKVNKRSVWTIPTQAFPEAHFATFPTKLVEPCIKAGTKEGDLVLDPFSGAGTVALVAQRLGRDSIGCELSPEYAAMARKRIAADMPLFQGEAK